MLDHDAPRFSILARATVFALVVGAALGVGGTVCFHLLPPLVLAGALVAMGFRRLLFLTAFALALFAATHLSRSAGAHTADDDDAAVARPVRPTMRPAPR
jgi:hypothetical protein